MRPLFLLFIWFGLTNPGAACLNSYWKAEFPNREGANYLASITEHDLKKPWTSLRDELAHRISKDPSLENLNDYAVALCHTDDAKRAIEILLQIEKDHPGAFLTSEPGKGKGTSLPLYQLARTYASPGTGLKGELDHFLSSAPTGPMPAWWQRISDLGLSPLIEYFLAVVLLIALLARRVWVRCVHQVHSVNQVHRK